MRLAVLASPDAATPVAVVEVATPGDLRRALSGVLPPFRHATRYVLAVEVHDPADPRRRPPRWETVAPVRDGRARIARCEALTLRYGLMPAAAAAAAWEAARLTAEACREANAQLRGLASFVREGRP